jgi:hypothetical protein
VKNSPKADRDGAAHFCPQCQIKRAQGPIIDCLAISEPPPAVEAQA